MSRLQQTFKSETWALLEQMEGRRRKASPVRPVIKPLKAVGVEKERDFIDQVALAIINLGLPSLIAWQAVTHPEAPMDRNEVLAISWAVGFGLQVIFKRAWTKNVLDTRQRMLRGKPVSARAAFQVSIDDFIKESIAGYKLWENKRQVTKGYKGEMAEYWQTEGPYGLGSIGRKAAAGVVVAGQKNLGRKT